MSQKLYEHQEAIGTELFALHQKLEKQQVRRAQFEEVRKRVDTLLTEFRKNDAKLISMGEKDTAYFEKGYATAVEDCGLKIYDCLLDKAPATFEEQPMAKQNDEENTQTNHSINIFKKRLEEAISQASNQSKSVLEIVQLELTEQYERVRDKFDKLKNVLDYTRKNFLETRLSYYEALRVIRDETDSEQRRSRPTTSTRIQEIKLPTFDGTKNEWASFCDLFMTMVHNNDDLTSVEKMFQLKAIIKGEAAKLIQHLTVTSNNYYIAWDLLKQRYENQRLIFSTLVDKILDQPNINSDSAASVRQLLDTTNECVRSIEALGIEIQDAKPFIARIIMRKFDNEAMRQYEFNIKKPRKIQTLEDVLEFLNQISQALEELRIKKSGCHQKPVQKQYNYVSTEISCAYCKNRGHRIFDCRKFERLNVQDRRYWAKNSKACYICLHHTTDKKCFKPTAKCTICGGSHNILLHYENPAPQQQAKSANKSGTFITKQDNAATVLLATAQVRVQNVHGEYITLRALVDQGSQKSTISEEAAQILQLPRIKSKTELYGLGDTLVGVSKSRVNVAISPRILSKEKFFVEALVLPTLSNAQPDDSFEYDFSKWNNYSLADPDFNKSDRIDMVLGADVYHYILEEEENIRKVDTLTGQPTKLGWMLSGVLQKPKRTPSKVYSAVARTLEKFWEREEMPDEEDTNLSQDECVTTFEKTTTLNDENRFVVKLPFLDDCELGDSRKQAVARFLNLEKRLEKDEVLRQQYINFMREYIEMGHMKAAKLYSGKYYLPHQPVIREQSISTKLRVVFDASATTSNQRSLNDVLKIGPKLQKDIFDIIVKWRLWRHVISADVEKMYRQILVQDEDQKYLHIVWREKKESPLKEYTLTTVTYGTTSATFLAQKTLHTIADSCSGDDQNIQEIIKNDFYMDDLMTGADSMPDLIEIREKLSTQLGKFGFPLRKWMSNSSEILKTIPDYGNFEVLPIKDDEAIKTLGLQWHPKNDVFIFKHEVHFHNEVTKRRALSILARIFDPLGWLTPFTTCIKLFIQKLWLAQTDWDVELEQDLQKEWEIIMASLQYLNPVKIPRWFNTTLFTVVELHAFADASQKAYAAVVYIKIGSVVNLVAAKSRVNSVKNRKTLPKLELCAAHLSAKLVSRIMTTIKNEVVVNAWSDSTITLSWISNKKSKEKFIRSRVEDIHKLTPNAVWRHVDTKSNPADAASRGVTAEKITSLWWNGPSWLNSGEANWPKQHQNAITMTVQVRNPENWIKEVSKRCSTFRKLERVVAYVIRFVDKLKGHTFPNWLTSNELHKANKLIIQQHQAEIFFAEIHSLKQQRAVNIKSKTASLHPFLDELGILRVGGRLHNSQISYMQKHPILLERSWLAELLIKQTHNNTLHGGNNLVASIVRRTYWIIGMKILVKKVIRCCVQCTRYRKENANQIMGNLPQSRVAISHPFTNTGVDYAGPIQMKCSRGRGRKTFKGYIALFVCMATRAIHLEAVSDLTTDAFLAALRRFFARRGKAKRIYSDNGTNFIGAARKLDKEFIEAIKINSSVNAVLEAEKIEWHFIPPASPHFGGIWEAGVKSVKHHLRRVIGESILTFEEMATLLAQIEAVLNSRPMCSVAGGPEDIDVLTPGHFLIGQPLLEIPENVDEKAITSMDRWKIVQKIKKDFWNRWKEEYLVTLQHRYKWRLDKTNLEENQVVIIKDESTSPSKWPLGKVIETHLGKDGKVRVVTVKTQNGIVKRPIHKLCPLEESKEQNEQTQETACMNLTNTKTKSSVKKALTYMFMILMCATLVKAIPEPAASVRELGNTTIMYLDKIGSLTRVVSSWNLLVYYNMEPYFSTVNHIESIINETKGICPKIRSFEDQCYSVILGMEGRLKDIKENDKLFSHQRKKPQKEPRVKRAPFEFVGSFYHVLFGIMDEDDRQSVEENMRNLLENQYNLKDMIKKQTSVVESTLNILKKTTDDVNFQFKIIREKMNNMSEIFKTDYYMYKESIHFFMATRQLEIMVDEAEKVQTQVIGLLMDINHGKINPNLIRPSKMQEEVIKIKNSLSGKLRLPGKSKEDILPAIYRLMTARGVFVDEKLVIDIKIPLLEAQSSDIFNMIPLPVMKNQTKMQPILRQQFLVYNYDIDSYHLITQSVLNQCKGNGEDEYLCRGNWAWDDANDHSCELSALKPSNPYNCSFTDINSSDIWKELHTKGRWLFRTYVDRAAHIVCSKETQEIKQLPQQGVLTMAPGCTARVGRTTLTSPLDSHSQQLDAFKSHLFKEAKDAEIIKPIQASVIGQGKRVDELLEELNLLKSENINLKSLNWHHVSGHSSLLIVVILVIIIIIFLVKKNCLKNQKSVDIKFNIPGQNV